MAQEIDPFNENPPTKQSDRTTPFSLTHFSETEGMKGTALEVSNEFKSLAERIVMLLPDSTLRTISVERLLDIRGSVCNFLKARK